MAEITLIPHAKIFYDKLIIYDELHGYTRKGNSTSFKSDDMYRCNYHGVLSAGAKKKIRAIIYLWLNALYSKKFVSRKNEQWIRYQVTFLTLTLPSMQIHTDKEIKRDMLNRFFIELKRKADVYTYLNVCEKQENKNIHFHVLLEKYVDWKLIRSIWNKILNDNGYIENYRNNQLHFHKDGFKLRENLISVWSEIAQRKAYEYGMATNWNDPNSTDIHALEKVKNIGAYITKYVCKGIDIKLDAKLNEINKNLYTEDEMKSFRKKFHEDLVLHYKIDGKIWSCSTNLESLKNADFIIENELLEVVEAIVNNKKTDVYKGESFMIAKNNTLIELRNKSPIYYNKFMEIQNKNYQLIYNN